MNKLKGLLRNLSGLLIAAVFLYFTLRKTDLSKVFDSLSQASWGFVVLSFICLLIVFYLRALRWKLLLHEAGENPPKNKVLVSVLLGYLVNSFTPKLGEIVRCTSLQESSKTPVASAMGSVVAERAYDMLVLLLGIAVIFLIEFNRLIFLFKDTFTSYLSSSGYFYLLIGSGIVFCILFLLTFKKIKKSENKLVKRAVSFAKGMFSALKKGLMLKQRVRFIVLTLAVWLMLVVLNYIYLLCLPETRDFSFGFACVILFIGGLGWALPTPGGIGTTHYFLLQLFLAYQLPPEAGVTFGILSNGLTFMGTLFFGGIAYIKSITS